MIGKNTRKKIAGVSLTTEMRHTHNKNWSGQAKMLTYIGNATKRCLPAIGAESIKLL